MKLYKAKSLEAAERMARSLHRLVGAQCETLYFWLFRHARNPVARWAWRRCAGALTAIKHFERGNKTEGWRWVRWTLAP